MKKNMFAVFLNKLLDFPLWVKQIIFLRLHENLSLVLSEDFIPVNEIDLFHLYVPTLSFLGKTELVERKSGLDEGFYNFLSNVADGLNILEIAMNNFLTMEEVAKQYILGLEQNFIKTPESVVIYAMAGFMSGKFRTGEYFKRSGKINVDQLEEALFKQKQALNKGEQPKIAEVMIMLGFVTEKDTKSLLLIKEEAKRRFILDSSIIPNSMGNFEAKVEEKADFSKEEFTRLIEQNKILKEQLTKILALVQKNA